MAVLAGQQLKVLFRDGDADRIALYAVRNANTGDTVDLAADFSVLKRAVAIGATVAGSNVVSVSGTVATIPAGLSADSAWILAYGCAT